MPRAFPTSTCTKEIVMNEELEMEMEIVELGDAKQETKGLPSGPDIEDNETFPFRESD
jgi:hypothetical protein